MISPPTEILFNCIKECKTLYFVVTETLRYNVKWILHQAEQQYLMFKKQKHNLNCYKTVPPFLSDQDSFLDLLK